MNESKVIIPCTLFCPSGDASSQLSFFTLAGMVALGQATPDLPASLPHRWSDISDSPPAAGTAPWGARGATLLRGKRWDCRPEAAADGKYQLTSIFSLKKKITK